MLNTQEEGVSKEECKNVISGPGIEASSRPSFPKKRRVEEASSYVELYYGSIYIMRHSYGTHKALLPLLYRTV